MGCFLAIVVVCIIAILRGSSSARGVRSGFILPRIFGEYRTHIKLLQGIVSHHAGERGRERKKERKRLKGLRIKGNTE